jgi:hypothetical protein
MRRNLERLVEKAKAQRREEIAAATIPILCDTCEEVPARIDVLIADGKLSEADRPRCVFWLDYAGLDAMTHDQWVLAMLRNRTDEEVRRAQDEAFERAVARQEEDMARDRERAAKNALLWSL